jgi:hypothetical protein
MPKSLGQNESSRYKCFHRSVKEVSFLKLALTGLRLGVFYDFFMNFGVFFEVSTAPALQGLPPPKRYVPCRTVELHYLQNSN